MGKQWKQWETLFFWRGGSKITADGDSSHEVKRYLFLGRKTMTNLDSILKSKDITWQAKVCRVKTGFSSSHVWMWELDHEESWVLKNWCFFKLWCWRRLLRVPWTARRSNQSILKEISPEYSLEGLMLKLKGQYFGHLIRRANSLEKTLMLGKIEGRRRATEDEDSRMESLTQWTWIWASSGNWWWIGRPGVLQSMGSQTVGHDWATELN